MKKLIALLLVLAISSFCMFSCKKDNGANNGGGNNGGNSQTGGNGDNGDGEIEEDEGGLLNKDNIDPDGWTKVDK